MREFRCKDLGYKCGWKHVATEDLLADVAALHLREVHQVPAISQELLGRIRNLFSRPEPADAAVALTSELKEYRCEVADCTWRYVAMTEDLIVDGMAVHAREAHGIREFTPEMIARVKQAIHPWLLSAESGKAA